MRVRMSTLLMALPLLGMLGLGGCMGITTLQFRDFLYSTLVQVSVQSLIDLIRASLTGA